MKAQTESVVLVGASSRPYAAFQDEGGRTVAAGTSWKVEIKDGDGPTRAYKASAEAAEKAKALPVGSAVVLLLDVRTTGARVVGVSAAPAGR